MTSRAFVPVEASERSRLQLRANLADCRRIREVWLQRKRDNENRDSGFSVSLATQCTNELRAIAEEEAALAIDLLKRMRDAGRCVLDEPFGSPVRRAALLDVIQAFEASNADG